MVGAKCLYDHAIRIAAYNVLRFYSVIKWS